MVKKRESDYPIFMNGLWWFDFSNLLTYTLMGYIIKIPLRGI